MKPYIRPKNGRWYMSHGTAELRGLANDWAKRSMHIVLEQEQHRPVPYVGDWI